MNVENQYFRYCPNCKSQEFKFIDGKKFLCKDCHFTYYHNVAGAVAVILHQGQNILFTVRNEAPSKGKLDLAGGFIDPQETAENAAKRELKEEIGIAIDTSKLCYVGTEPNRYLYNGIEYNTIDLFYTYELTEEIKEINHSEISHLVWIHIKDIDEYQLAFDSMKKFFQNNKKKLLW